MKNNRKLKQQENFIDMHENDNSLYSYNYNDFSGIHSPHKSFIKNKDRNKDKYYKQQNKNNFQNNYSTKKTQFLGNKRNNNYSTEQIYLEYRKNNTNNPNDSKNKSYRCQEEENTPKKNLPIYQFKDEIIQKIKDNRVIIISGNTGCGKSTQVPQYIFNLDKNNTILMTQPRRIAAVSIAKRLAEEMRLKLGYKIGFHVSMNPNFCKDTKILVETTGVFMEELIHNNLDYSHIILDEVHERDIFVDLVLALIKWYFEKNPNSKIKLILMSATIAERSFAEYLKSINGGQIPIIKIKESLHTVKEFNLETIFKYIKEDKSITKKLKNEVESVVQSCLGQVKSVPVFMIDLFPVVAAIIEKIENENKFNQKGVLIFVPGIGEIQDLQDYLSKYFINKNNLDFLILHSQISDIEQDKIFKNNNNKRKIILATNIAESSITISNIDFVIDFCLVKQTRFDETQNSSVLELKWCSKASCQQRKGRTGRVNSGFYFQLITKKLSESLSDHPKPEILRTTLENPILKLKIYEPEYEPSDILLKTINPPSVGTILRTIFNLEKMGALIRGKVIEFKTKEGIKKYYKSGIITKIGRIFAELPIEIKYSRLIMISYALGEIDLGITLAAILSQDKSIFLNSDKCNRYNLYKAKNFYCFQKECDFIASYTAYKQWYYNYGDELVNKNIKFDTQLKYINREKYNEIKKYTNEHILDLRVLKEVIKVENDLKKRLTKFKLYSTFFDSHKNPKKSINFQQEENVFLLKIILTGAFYNNIYVPEYENTRNIEDNILNIQNSDKQIELRTLRFYNTSPETAKKLFDIFEAISEPDNIIDDEYSESSELYKLVFDKVEPVKKILFVTSPSIKRNKEIPIFCFKNMDNDNRKNMNITNDDDDDNISLIKLEKEPEYFYRLRYFDEYLKENIFQDKDSVNFIQIIPDLEKLRNCKLVTDTIRGKLSRSSNYTKYSKYSSVLPNIENFDKLMMLVFAPKYEMVGVVDEKTGKILQYKGFQSHEFTGLNEFSDKDIKDIRFYYERAILVKFDYLITNYHLNIIDEIRVLINDIIKFKFISKFKDVDNEDEKINEENMTQEEFDELYNEYKSKTRKIIEQIRFLLNIKKVRNINNENYQELYDYINDVKYKKKLINSFKGKLSGMSYESSTNYESRSLSESENENNNEKDNDNEENTDNKEDSLQSYQGYINSIYDLKKKYNLMIFFKYMNHLKLKENIFLLI